MIWGLLIFIGMMAVISGLLVLLGVTFIKALIAAVVIISFLVWWNDGSI